MAKPLVKCAFCKSKIYPDLSKLLAGQVLCNTCYDETFIGACTYCSKELTYGDDTTKLLFNQLACDCCYQSAEPDSPYEKWTRQDESKSLAKETRDAIRLCLKSGLKADITLAPEPLEPKIMTRTEREQFASVKRARASAQKFLTAIGIEQ